MIYRKATLDDVEQLTNLRLRLLIDAKDKYNPEAHSHFHHEVTTFFKNELNQSIVVYVAEQDGKIVATNGAVFQKYFPRLSDDVNKSAHITNVYTLPDYRRQGISKKLLQILLEELTSQNYRFIWLWGTNMAYPLYKQSGFEDYNSYDTMLYNPAKA